MSFTDKIKKLFGSFQNRLETGSVVHATVSKNNAVLDGNINIGENCRLEHSVLKGKISVGQKGKITKSTLEGKITIGSNSKIIDGVELAGEIEIGNYTSINGPNTDLRSRLNPVKIGNFCSIARNVTFQEFNHDFSRLTSYFVNHNMLGKPAKDDLVSKGPITVGHDVWIGTHCIILSGVTIGTGAVVAANTVVARDVPPYAIVGGNPAQVIRYRFDEATVKELLASEWWDKPEQEIIAYYKAFGRKDSTGQQL